MIDPQAVENLVARRTRLNQTPLSELSPRELDVLRDMAQGKTNAAIALDLALSESSVEKHVYTIFSKLGLTEESQVHRRVAAVLTFLREAGRQEVSVSSVRSTIYRVDVGGIPSPTLRLAQLQAGPLTRSQS